MTTHTPQPSKYITLLLLLTGILLFWTTVPNLGDAARAATADGPRGTFTATRLVCAGHAGHTTCEWSGTFRSTDNTVYDKDVKLYGSDRDTFTAGQTAPAVDVGNPGRVYDPTGSHTWIVTVILVILAYTLLAVTAHRHLVPPGQRTHHSTRATPTSSPPPTTPPGVAPAAGREPGLR
ncbi:hypothetical protein AB0G71_11905 [Streptomyces sp. NPDC020403]|uniref:hypothetical protein n=1 Tax=unclassified Streptomyces TaxID=2593676 RepID=UPI0033C8A6FA